MTEAEAILFEEAEGGSLMVVDYSAQVEGIKLALQPWDAKIKTLAEAATNMEVANDEWNAGAVELTAMVKRAAKELETHRKALVAGPNDYLKAVNGLFKHFTGQLEGIEYTLKRKIGDYRQRQEMERRKAEAAARAATEAAQKRINEEAEAHGVEPVKLEAPEIPQASSTTRTAAGTSSIKKVWTAVITNPNKVPRKYCTPDMALIRQAVKAGIRNIPGVRISEESQVNIRV